MPNLFEEILAPPLLFIRGRRTIIVPEKLIIKQTKTK
jgi:hypothetical protein